MTKSEDEIMREHFDADRRVSFAEYVGDVALDEHGRLPVGLGVTVTPFYERISSIPAGTKGRVARHFLCVYTPSFSVLWEDHESTLPMHAPTRETWHSGGYDLMRWELLGPVADRLKPQDVGVKA